MSFRNHDALAEFMVTLGVKKAFFKQLSENDNSKQQIYLGGDFKALTDIPFGEIIRYSDLKEPNFKAPVDFWWINNERQYSQAPTTQLILYPRYPEVRLSGFMTGCPTAPKGYMDPIPKDKRGEKNGKDGRILVLGITTENRVYAFLAVKESAVSNSLLGAHLPEDFSGGTLQRFPLTDEGTRSKEFLLARLSEIHHLGWIESCRLDKNGKNIKYNARNGGGYTLESLFGIIPNGKADPDFMGWELKAFSKSRLTLMTPEPDAGFYNKAGAKEFVLKYGRNVPNKVKYFTGTHKVGDKNKTSGMLMELKGFNRAKGTIEDINGGIYLLAPDGSEAAIWSFPVLISHWCRKHAHTCYVRCKSELQNGEQGFSYLTPAYLGEGTDFSLFLQAMAMGKIVYDPGSSISILPSGNTGVKARSQFRMNFKQLGSLYTRFEEHHL